jgi:hypothetical protein
MIAGILIAYAQVTCGRSYCAFLRQRALSRNLRSLDHNAEVRQLRWRISAL